MLPCRIMWRKRLDKTTFLFIAGNLKLESLLKIICSLEAGGRNVVNKSEQIGQFAQSKEDRILLSNLLDRAKACRERNDITWSGFLDMRQRTMASHMLGKQAVFTGGYENAERTIAVFLPDYIEQMDETDSPLTLLKVTHSGYRKLTHRDYLGSLLALQIKREMIGDILPFDNGAFIIVLKDIANFLIDNYTTAAKEKLSCCIVPFSELELIPRETKLLHETVPSLRLDNILHAAFGIKRTEAASLIENGKVFINSLECKKCDRSVREKDKITLRGRGKAVLTEIGRTTKKGRISILIEKY